jgi:hypothetical protein
MKRIAKLSFSFTAIILLLSVNILQAQDNTIEKVYKWTYNTDNDPDIEFVNYDCDLIIHTWDKAEVLFELSVNATFRNESDANKFDDHVKDYKFDNSSHEVSLKNRFWSSRKNIAGIKTMKLSGNGNIYYKKFAMKGEIWIPADADLRLVSKYSKLSIDDINGELDLDLYNDDIEGGKANKDVNIVAKYSSIEFDSFGDLDANLYDCNLYLKDIKSAKFNTKYSEINSDNIGKLEIESYTDKYIFNTTGDINLTSKYTSLISVSSGELIIDSYDGSVETKDCKDVKLTSKYTKYTFGTVGRCKVLTSYTDKITSAYLVSLDITESKYTKYNIEELESSLSLTSGYDDEFVIAKIGSGFSKISLNGKYITCEFGIPDDVDYRLIANVKYPHFDINEDNLTLKLKIVESSQMEYEAYIGTELPDMPLISITGYEMKVKINN